MGIQFSNAFDTCISGRLRERGVSSLRYGSNRGMVQQTESIRDILSQSYGEYRYEHHTDRTGCRYPNSVNGIFDFPCTGGNYFPGCWYFPLPFTKKAGWRAAISICTLPAALLMPLIALRYPGRSKKDITTTSTGLWRNIESIIRLVLRNRNVFLLATVYGLKERAP